MGENHKPLQAMTSPRGLGGVFSLPVTGCSCLLSLAATFCSLIPPRPCPIPGAPALQDSQPPILVLCPAGSQWAGKAVPFHSQLWFGHLKQPFVATLPCCWLDVSRGLIAAAECCHSHGRASNPHALGMSELPPCARQTAGMLLILANRWRCYRGQQWEFGSQLSRQGQH